MSFRDAIKLMWTNVNMTWDEAMEHIKDIQLDRYFLEFYNWVKQNSYSFTVLSR